MSGSASTMSSQSPLSSPNAYHQWPQHPHAEKSRDDDRELRSPQWTDYPTSPSPIRQSPSSSPSPFRIPRGRPPSRQTHLDDSETFLKPLPKDNHLNDFIKTEPMYHDDRFGHVPYDPYTQPPPFYSNNEQTKAEPIGEVTDYHDNEECFQDSQMGGVGIALSHGSVLFEVAKQELHATTALRRPNRQNPSRISLVFYQHRNLNRPRHGWDQWEEKMRLRKLGLPGEKKEGDNSSSSASVVAYSLEKTGSKMLVRAPTYTTTTWTTLFPMRPCMVTGPYQEGGGQ